MGRQLLLESTHCFRCGEKLLHAEMRKNPRVFRRKDSKLPPKTSICYTATLCDGCAREESEKLGVESIWAV